MALALGSFGMAQSNTSAVTQSGTGNAANVSQTGASNASTITNTNGADNTVKVAQVGQTNVSTFETTDGSSINVADRIYQNGVTNTSASIITGDGNDQSVDQRGEMNGPELHTMSSCTMTTGISAAPRAL